MGKHKFNSGRVCEYCGELATDLTKVDGKFLSCSEAPTEEGIVQLRHFIVLESIV
jgi:hypothetical protein